MGLMRRTEDRFPSVPALVVHLQTETEREKAGIARELHDELGGLLVAASMDLAWLDHELKTSLVSGSTAEVRRRLQRLRDALAGAVDIKRKIIEELHPTLLDNVGLFAALRWLVSTTTARTGLAGETRFPATEPDVGPQASIALFRMAQSGIGLIMESKWVRSITLALEEVNHRLTLSVSGRGDPHPPEERSRGESYQLAAIRHRMGALAGGVNYSTTVAGEITVSAWLPMQNTLPC
jgi:signal transduction histidine kinase